VCIHKSLCNGLLTTDKKIITIFKFGTHNHAHNTNLIITEKAEWVMKNTAEENHNLEYQNCNSIIAHTKNANVF